MVRLKLASEVKTHTYTLNAEYQKVLGDVIGTIDLNAEGLNYTCEVYLPENFKHTKILMKTLERKNYSVLLHEREGFPNSLIISWDGLPLIKSQVDRSRSSTGEIKFIEFNG